MSVTEYTVRCPLPTLEGVTVTYNMMASQAEFDAFGKALGGNGTARPVISQVEGWPVERYGPDPFGPGAPLAFLIWVVGEGLKTAITGYIGDPNSWTASTASMPPTSVASSSRRPTPTSS